MAKLGNLMSSRTPSIKPADERNGLGIIFDAIFHEEDSRESQLASYPTETAFNGNDHTLHRNPTLMLIVGVSDNPAKMQVAKASSATLGGPTNIIFSFENVAKCGECDLRPFDFITSENYPKLDKCRRAMLGITSIETGYKQFKTKHPLFIFNLI